MFSAYLFGLFDWCIGCFVRLPLPWGFEQTLDGIQEVTRARLYRSAAAIQRIARGYVARKKVRGYCA